MFLIERDNWQQTNNNNNNQIDVARVKITNNNNLGLLKDVSSDIFAQAQNENWFKHGFT